MITTTSNIMEPDVVPAQVDLAAVLPQHVQADQQVHAPAAAAARRVLQHAHVRLQAAAAPPAGWPAAAAAAARRVLQHAHVRLQAQRPHPQGGPAHAPEDARAAHAHGAPRVPPVHAPQQPAAPRAPLRHHRRLCTSVHKSFNFLTLNLTRKIKQHRRPK
eukprot:CAMPEP_0194744354 /NCGR_PEP_ID=MMETSP0296-20130528/100818_1 /TAXON_ID=39354 /ORGANISM="Heterosigma akashiwo, Strain CCMP2393" /LENGTH=159 /DNA_ID=CAMNT_0039656485 /DNA_START=290 /DNA_END=768 /DNA_ORIENTATION=-